jgi:hypothetical protein
MTQVKHEEQYTLITPRELDFDDLQKAIAENLSEGHKNFVIDLKGSVGTVEDAHHFAGLMSIIEKEDGRLVIACPPTELEESLEEAEIVTTPTLDEATDYIFMEEIERQLMEDGGEDWPGEE